jgi:hypothetical protein
LRGFTARTSRRLGMNLENKVRSHQATIGLNPPAEAALCLESRGEHLHGLASKYRQHDLRALGTDLDQHMIYPRACSTSGQVNSGPPAREKAPGPAFCRCSSGV